jgi:uncharacterized protein (DUF1330 family)
MKATHKLALAVLAGVGLGGAIVEGIHAQTKPPAYVVVAIRKINDADAYKEVLAKAPAAAKAAGGTFVVRTDKITTLDGTSPARFVLLKFDSVEEAQAWYNSPAQKEINALRIKTTDSLAFIVPGDAM